MPGQLRTFLLLFALTSCLTEPPPGSAAAALALRACDARGQPASLTNLPRQPTLLLELPATTAPEGPPWLFVGAMDASLARDLARLPLTAASQARLVTTRRALSGHDLALMPESTLHPGADYTLALPLSALSQAQAQLNQHTPWSAALHVDDSSAAGAAVRGSYPAPGAAHVSPRLSWVALSFDGEVYGNDEAIWMEDAAGFAVPGAVESIACDQLDTAAISCRRWLPDTALAAETSYTLRSGGALRDAHGAEVEALQAVFTTAAADEAAMPPWQPGMCAVDEQPLEQGCARVLDDRIALRLFPSPSTRVAVSLDEQHFSMLPQRDGVRLQLTGLSPDAEQALAISGFDAEEHELRREVRLRTAAALPTLAISEVYADPAGREPDQEFVELWNFGPHALPLSGLYLGDSLRERGQPIESNASLAPGARALLVSDAFSEASALDTPPLSGSVLVRMGKALTPSGLSNRGEALYLRDAVGHRLSSAPERPAPQAGQCLSRIGLDPRADEPPNFRLDDVCTPGS